MQQQVGKKSGGTSSLQIMIYQYQISITLFDSRGFFLFFYHYTTLVLTAHTVFVKETTNH